MSTTEFVVGVGLLFWLLTCIAVVDIARKDFGGIEKKAMWGFISLLPFLGPILYFLLGYRKGKPPQP